MIALCSRGISLFQYQRGSPLVEIGVPCGNRYQARQGELPAFRRETNL
jgi:hypothetical protein